MIETLAQRVRDVLMDGDNNLTLEDLTLVASMAEHGLLGFLDSMVLKDLDLSTIPTDQLAPLFSSVTRRVDFWNISGRGPFMDILKCDVVGVFGQSLGTEETRALVRAMETRVRMVTLGGCVTLDTEALLQYSGQGRCGKLAWSYQTEAEKELRSWAFRRKWTVRNNLELIRNSDINHRLVVSMSFRVLNGIFVLINRSLQVKDIPRGPPLTRCLSCNKTSLWKRSKFGSPLCNDCSRWRHLRMEFL